ncbi:toll/interleukin-1 receptor domain-containing protein [Zavarzinia compransoris]|uniref:toll/interleukin-1 receptor domain-containing protein n=1 Tax=Zavarzinia marina TaxID=2911065 RepID=UPI001F2C8D35|nr:toll/interleukin-1 receptor domain-containing protein [Zavarzinia marina]MCF4166640.1 toll/interleukin-1 receptor domain-containing protein [Zavarzinia marina]
MNQCIDGPALSAHSSTMSPRRYAAFISYSHADETFAARLHRRIETWRTPRRLVGARGRDGEVPARLFPVFRDREELPTSADLGGAIRQALEGSRYLIVLCSPRAAGSIWVDQEILEFKRRHGEGRIIAAILSDEPDVCFPRALRFRLGPDGSLSDEPTEPIAADFRPGKDGWRLGTLKILAGLLGVDLDDLVRREARRQRQRRLALGAGAAGVAIAAALGAHFWIKADHHRALEAQAARGLAELRGGDTFAGTDRFVTAARDLGDDATPAQRRLARALTARLTPYSAAVAELDDDTVVSWRGQAWLKRGDGLTALAEALNFADLGDRILLARPGRLEAVDKVTLKPAWHVDLEEGERLCGLWSDDDGRRLYLEGEYIGMTVGASYGFKAWLDPATGAMERGGMARIGQTVCTGDETPGAVTGRFTRLDRVVRPFDWPRLRPEGRMWAPSDFIQPPPLLPSTEQAGIEHALLARAVDEDLPPLPYPTWIERIFACDGQRHAAGYSSVGNSGGSIALCALDGDTPTCAEHDFIGVVKGWTVAPYCSAVAAWGYGLTGRHGLSLFTADLAEAPIDGLPETAEMRLGAFSPSGRLFATTDGARRLFVFTRTGSGFVRSADHDMGVPIHALTFLGEDTVALVAGGTELRAVDAASGKARWPAVPLAPWLGERIEAARDDHDWPVATLAATPEGDALAFAVRLDQETVYRLEPGLRPRTPDGSPAEGTPGQFAAYARFFDGTLGVPLGGRLSLTWTLGWGDLEDPWARAVLARRDDGTLTFSYEPYAAFDTVPEETPDAPLPALTGIGPDGPLAAPPR